MTPGARGMLLAILAGCAAAYGVLSINRSGLVPAIHGDSVQYLAAAESFARDGTFRVPQAHWSEMDSVSVLSHYPPGFPVLISLALGREMPAHTAALLIIAVSSAIALALFTLLVYEAGGAATAALTAVVLLITPVWVRLHLAVWSEPSFMAVTAALLYGMVRWPRASWLHGLLAAAGAAIRYVGVAGAVAAAAWAWSLGSSTRDRLARAAVALAPSGLFLAWWRASVADGGGVVRELGFYGDLGRSLRVLGPALTEWVVPGGRRPEHAWLAAPFILLALLVIGMAAKRGAWQQARRRPVVRAALLYGGSYAGVLLASRLLADPQIPFDERLFMPVLVLATACFTISATDLARAAGRRGWAALALVVGAWMFAAARESRTMVASVNETGMYYTLIPWLADRSIRWVDEESESFPVVYSNDPTLLYFLTERHARSLPDDLADLPDFARLFRASPGAVVILYLPQPVEPFVATLGLRLAAQGSMGAAYVPE